MIEAILYDFLSHKVSIPVKTEIPKTPPEKFYLIEKTGGGETNFIKRATVTIQSYGDSLYDAASLNETLKETILAADGLITLDSIVSVKLSSDYNFTDTTTKKYRYQAVFEIVHD